MLEQWCATLTNFSARSMPVEQKVLLHACSTMHTWSHTDLQGPTAEASRSRQTGFEGTL